MGLLDIFKRSTPVPTARRTQKRYYNAGSNDRLTSNWTTEVVSIDDVINRNLKTLKARAREQYQNNDYASRFTALLRANVVGPNGVIIQATVENSPRYQKTAGKYDQPVNDAIEAGFKKWGRKEFCDLSCRLNWVEMQRLVMQTVGIDGECVIVMDDAASNPYGFALRLVDSNALDVDLNVEPTAQKNRIRFGIEMDMHNKPISYYFKTRANAENAAFLNNGKAYDIVPAHRVLHIFITEAVGQKRGLPMMAGALFRMNMLTGYEDAAITAARVGAAKMGFFTSPDGDGYTGDGVDTDGAVISDVSPGTFEQLPQGVTFTPYDPEYPHQQFPDFVKTCLRGISSGLNVSYHALSNDLEGVNYSSIRAGVLEDRETWKSLQNWFIDALVKPVYEQWLLSAVMRGAIVLPGGSALRTADLDRYMSASYQPRRWAWVDPQKDTTANVLAVQNALKSRGEIIREQGRDPEDVWRELAEEQERMKQLGIVSESLSIGDAAAMNNGANNDE